MEQIWKLFGRTARKLARYLPTVLGHESAGRVVQIGEKVKAYKIGDMVVRASLPSTDKYASSWGGFSEYGLVTDAKAMEADGKSYSPGLTQQVSSGWNYSNTGIFDDHIERDL